MNQTELSLRLNLVLLSRYSDSDRPNSVIRTNRRQWQVADINSHARSDSFLFASFSLFPNPLVPEPALARLSLELDV